MATIDSFRGEFFFLSNFYVEQDGSTVEHRFQAAKTTDSEAARLIAFAPTPSAAKARGGRSGMETLSVELGRTIELRPDWEEIKVGVMRGLLRDKFADPELAARLLATGDAELIEGNTWNDRFWGSVRGAGQNWLGRLLMERRVELSSARVG
ncbi:MAG TPA: NADAR family protein [Gaiellaceae bacterium]|jgi:hypothetical protein